MTLWIYIYIIVDTTSRAHMSELSFKEPLNGEWRSLVWGLFTSDAGCFEFERLLRTGRRPSKGEKERQVRWIKDLATSQRSHIEKASLSSSRCC